MADAAGFRNLGVQTLPELSCLIFGIFLCAVLYLTTHWLLQSPASGGWFFDLFCFYFHSLKISRQDPCAGHRPLNWSIVAGRACSCLRMVPPRKTQGCSKGLIISQHNKLSPVLPVSSFLFFVSIPLDYHILSCSCQIHSSCGPWHQISKSGFTLNLTFFTVD